MVKSYDSICCFRSSNESTVKRVCWEITTDCNLNCPFCHRYGYNSEYYDISRLHQTIDILHKQNIKNVIISGGEPLLHPHFFKIIDALHIAGFSLDVCSNGVLMDSKTVSHLKDRLSEISVSIDGYEAKRHEYMRQTPGCFSETISGIQRLMCAGIEVHVTTVVDASFVEHIELMTDFLYEKGIRSVAFLGLIPLGTGKNPLFEDDNQYMIERNIKHVRMKYPDMAINTKQLLKSGCDCNCGAGKVIFGMGVDGTQTHPCLLLRKRPKNSNNKGLIGLCPGSQYLTQE